MERDVDLDLYGKCEICRGDGHISGGSIMLTPYVEASKLHGKVSYRSMNRGQIVYASCLPVSLH